MKNLPSLTKLVTIVACALSLAACNRAEYAMLPKTATYYGQHTIRVTPATPAVATTASQADDNQYADSQFATMVPAPSPPTSTRCIKTKVAKHPAASAQSVTVTTPVASEEVAVSPRKTTLGQRLALTTLSHKLDKALQKSSTVRPHDNTASVAKGGISGNLRIGLILLLVGLLVGFINGTIGGIIAIVGLIFIVLWLLDQM